MGASDTILVRISSEDKQALTSLARELGISVSELMREGALAYGESKKFDELAALADAAKSAAQDSCTVIDETLAYVRQSNARIDAMLDGDVGAAGQGADARSLNVAQ